MNCFIITKQEVEALHRAIDILRERVKQADSRTQKGWEEDKEALMGLLSIHPAPLATSPIGTA